MKKMMFLLFFLTVATSFGDTITVQKLNSTTVPIPKKDYEFIPGKQGPIDSKYRDQFFLETGLESHLGNYDDVERNVLYLRLKKLDIDKLKQLYPSFSPTALVKAHTALSKAL